MYRHWIAPMAVFFILWCRSGISILRKVPVAVPSGGFLLEVIMFYLQSSAQSCPQKGPKSTTSFFPKV